jgi:type II secretory pathway pseudopilin PulG
MKNLPPLEWLIVVVIIGILAAITIPKFVDGPTRRSHAVQRFEDSALRKVYDRSEGVVCYIIYDTDISCLRTR